jgi:hypothetical protein
MTPKISLPDTNPIFVFFGEEQPISINLDLEQPLFVDFTLSDAITSNQNVDNPIFYNADQIEQELIDAVLLENEKGDLIVTHDNTIIEVA